MTFDLTHDERRLLMLAADLAEKAAAAAEKAEEKAGLATMASQTLKGYAEESTFRLEKVDSGRVELASGNRGALAVGLAIYMDDLQKAAEKLGKQLCETDEIAVRIAFARRLRDRLRMGGQVDAFAGPHEADEAAEEEEQADLQESLV